MKTRSKWAVATALVAGLAACEKTTGSVNPELALVSSAAAEAELIAAANLKARDEADTKLGQYVINMMYRTSDGRKLSDGKKQVLARGIVRVVNDIFLEESHKKAFITAVAIESAFTRSAQSPTGPKGYAQLAKATFHEALKLCGINSVNDEDVWETDLNLYAGACYFRSLLELPEIGNDPFSAIVAYNQGPASKDLKTFVKGGSMEGLEPLKYVARFAFLSRTADTPEPGVPAINDLPKPASAVAKGKAITDGEPKSKK